MREVLANRERATRLMANAGVDALIACSPVNVRYLTGYWCWLAPLFREFMVAPGGSGELVVRNLAFLAADGHTALVLEPYWAVNAEAAFADEVLVAGGEAPYAVDQAAAAPADLTALHGQITRADWSREPLAALAAALRARGLDRGRIGVELEAFGLAQLADLGRVLPEADLVDCTATLRLVRAVKTGAELELLARSAAIAEAAAQAVLPEHASTAEAMRAFRAALGVEGADLDHLAYARAGLGFVTGGDVRLQPGETLYVDWGGIYEGWYSDSGTTLSVGEPDDEAQRRHGWVRDAVTAGAAALRPGVRGSDVQAIMQAALAEHGVTASFPHGHGFGLEVRDYPVLVPPNGRAIRDGLVDVSADLELEPGMVVNLEAPVLAPGAWSVHCERSFVITEAGSRPLADQDRERPLVLRAGAA
jgi:D-alanyl-D-alanine dipeptidase